MFRGQWAHNIDSKGRLNIPSKFKEILKLHYNEQLIITNLPKCLVVYPLKEWERIEQQFKPYTFGPREIMELKRYLLGSAVDCNLDGQGRILIPANLRKKISREVYLIGMIHYFEIWSREKIEQEHQMTEENFDDRINFVFEKYGIRL